MSYSHLKMVSMSAGGWALAGTWSGGTLKGYTVTLGR